MTHPRIVNTAGAAVAADGSSVLITFGCADGQTEPFLIGEAHLRIVASALIRAMELRRRAREEREVAGAEPAPEQREG